MISNISTWGWKNFSRRAYVMVMKMNLRRLNIVQMIFKSLEIVYDA
jgi:hypothetical protein